MLRRRPRRNESSPRLVRPQAKEFGLTVVDLAKDPRKKASGGRQSPDCVFPVRTDSETADSRGFTRLTQSRLVHASAGPPPAEAPTRSHRRAGDVSPLIAICSLRLIQGNVCEQSFRQKNVGQKNEGGRQHVHANLRFRPKRGTDKSARGNAQ